MDVRESGVRESTKLDVIYQEEEEDGHHRLIEPVPLCVTRIA